jgi:ornithine cyclodeaminase/alanine dehydrogenase-like protein (mu-crystallin family)
MATRALARADAGILALLGYGVQAASHLEAMRRVRDIRQVRVWGPDPQRAAEFAASGVKKKFEKLDKDGDGKLSKKEYSAALDEDCE